GEKIPPMSPGLLKKFRESLFEIFNNAVIHSKTKYGIFSCGQYFHKQRHLNFTITDLGIGFHQNIVQSLKEEMSPAEAICWAMEGRNNTKKGCIPGGLGLKLLQDFIKLNKGKLQICSDMGFWELSEGQVTIRQFDAPFPGTVVNIQINTADNQSYCLSSEINPDAIF
ncbi:MAG: hypothetical protein ACP5I1_06840, partial [Candidatus Hinthialibacter sp.]